MAINHWLRVRIDTGVAGWPKALFTLADPGAGSAALWRHGNAVGSAVAFTLTGSWPVGS